MKREMIIKAAVLFGGPLLLATACVNQSTPPTTSPSPTISSTPSPLTDARSVKGRAQIWAENCARCHNMRPPDWYSSAQWEVTMQHMRVRGYLTGEEHRAILELLQASK